MKKKQLPIHIIASWNEVSREQYVAYYGERALQNDSVFAAADRIAVVILDPLILELQSIEKGDYLIFNLLDENEYMVKTSSVNRGKASSMRGQVVNTSGGALYLSVHEGKALASLEIAEHNLHCLVKYNQASQKHYLFKIPMDKIIRPLKR